MLRLFIAFLLLFSETTALFSFEKNYVIEGASNFTFEIGEDEPGQQVVLESYLLENISDQPIEDIFLSLNTNRLEQKESMHKELLKTNNLWKWAQVHQLSGEKSGLYSSLQASVLKVPSRPVPYESSLKEFFFDDKWHLIDDQHHLIYLHLDNQNVAGYEDVADEPFLALRTKTTALEESYNFTKACENFARFDLFPKNFDFSEPLSNEISYQWHDYQFDLYPHETLLVKADGTVEQTIQLEERCKEEKLNIKSAFPILQVSNHSPESITLEEQNFLLEPHQTYLLEEPVFSLTLDVAEGSGKVTLLGKTAVMPSLKSGANEIDLNTSKKMGKIRFKINYKIDPAPSIFIANQDQHFDHEIPYFLIEHEGRPPEKIWWQISTDKNFASIIPNFQGIQDFAKVIKLDACSDTFFNPQQLYYFRIREMKDGEWSAWTPAYVFTVSKPDQVKDPLFKKIEDNKYQISWMPSKEPGTQYYIFASNAFDFMPSIYHQEQYNVIGEEELISEEVDNLVAITSECSMNIGTEYAFYRIIAERNGKFAIPSPLIRVYDYGLSIPRHVMQKTQVAPKKYRLERIPFPPAYPELQKENVSSGKSRALDTASLLKSYYTPSPYVDPAAWTYVSPFLLPENHPVKPKLDRLFSTRVTQNNVSLKKAGFTRPEPMKFSKTIVSPNKKIPGYMFKFFSDEQKGISDWERLLSRVTGSIFIQDALNRYNVNHLFVVPRKWLYPLPADPSPTLNSERKNFVLIADQLDIYTGSENNRMWKSPIITPLTLNWVFYLLQELGLNDSPYSFNMPITKDNRIAFIDTEHHHKWPVPHNKLWPFLSSEMGDYWNHLCKICAP